MYILAYDLLNPFWWLSAGVILFKAFAFLDAATRQADAYPAAEKKTKGFWLVLLGLALGLDLLLGGSITGSFITLAGLVAAIVYMVDVRPAIRALTGWRGPTDRLTQALRSLGRRGGGNRW